MEFDHTRFLQAVGARTGLDAEGAETAVATTLAAIGRALPAHAVPTVARTLPGELARQLRRGAETPAVAEFLADLAAHEQVSLGFAREHAQVVLEQLAELYDAPTRAQVADLLRPQIPDAAAWLVPFRAPAERRVPPTAADPRSLASGRPGSEHPISEAGSDRRQHDSPAATADPHASTRLSSSPGISTEREGSTIAAGRPGSSRPVSEGHE